MRVVKTDVVTLVMWVPERDAPLVSKKTDAIIQLDALRGTRIRAKVTRYSDYLDPDKGRDMRVEVDLPNKDWVLKSGMYGTMTLVLRTYDKAYLLPACAVFVRKPENAAWRSIETARTTRPSPFRRSCSRTSDGISWRHGWHHVAQKLMITGWPRYRARSVLAPSRSFASSGGAGGPGAGRAAVSSRPPGDGGPPEDGRRQGPTTGSTKIIRPSGRPWSTAPLPAIRSSTSCRPATRSRGSRWSLSGMPNSRSPTLTRPSHEGFP